MQFAKYILALFFGIFCLISKAEAGTIAQDIASLKEDAAKLIRQIENAIPTHLELRDDMVISPASAPASKAAIAMIPDKPVREQSKKVSVGDKDYPGSKVNITPMVSDIPGAYDRLVYEAGSLMAKGQWSRALLLFYETLDNAMLSKKELRKIHYYIGHILDMRGDTESAAKHFGLVLGGSVAEAIRMSSFDGSQKPDEAISRGSWAQCALIRLGDIMYREGLRDKSIELYRAAADRSSSEALGSLALYRLGRGYQENGKHKAALETFRELAGEYPGHFWTRHAIIRKDEIEWKLRLRPRIERLLGKHPLL